MKIANIVLTSQNGGVEQVFIDYQKILRDKLGHEVFSIIKDDAPYFKDLEKENIKFVKIKNKLGYNDFLAIAKIKKALQSFQADAVITHAGKASILTRKAIKKIKDRKVIQVAMNHSNNVKRSIGADIIFSINKEIFYKTIDLGQQPDKSFIIFNALDLDQSIAQKEINFNKKNISIGMMARFDRTKGFLEMLDAIKILNANSSKNFILKIAGGGYFEEEIKNKIKELKIEKNVEFLGWIQDKKKFFSQIDIFTLPSLEEPFGLVVLEAIKHFCPLIASNSDGPQIIIRNEIDGLLTQLNPPEEYPRKLAENILNMIQNEQKTKEMVASANERFINKFSFKRLEKDLENVFGKNI